MKERYIYPTSIWKKAENGGFKLVKSSPLEPINMSADESKMLITEEEINAIEKAKRVKEQQERERKKNNKLFKEVEVRKHLEEERKKEKARKQTEANIFAKILLKAMNGLTDEEILLATSKLYSDEKQFEKVVQIYTKSKDAEKYYSDKTVVVRKALSNILETTSKRIEQSHKEFSLIEPAKTMSR